MACTFSASSAFRVLFPRLLLCTKDIDLEAVLVILNKPQQCTCVEELFSCGDNLDIEDSHCCLMEP